LKKLKIKKNYSN